MTVQNIQEHMEVIGADGVHVGTVDRVTDQGIKLTRADGPLGATRHRVIPIGLVAEVEGDRVRLSSNGDVAVLFEEEEGASDPKDVVENDRLDEAGRESFPASDPPAVS
jgi:hypothetical protein